jgi:hypothetical protein
MMAELISNQQDKPTKGRVFACGVTLADERRFEAGDTVPPDIDKKELKELAELGALEG